MKRITILLLVALVAFILLNQQAIAKKDARVTVGDQAPDFSLPNQNGTLVSLKDFAEKKCVVLYFYPKDNVGVCKKEACLFRDQYRAFTDQGAEVIGVSNGTVKSHKDFVTRRNLPFILLSDKGGKVRKLYGVPRSAAGLLSGRETFVIDRKGTVRLTFNNLLHADDHVNEALKMIKEIGQTPSG